MPCLQTLAGIIRDCSPSIGGIVEAYIANYDDVSSVTAEEKVTAIEMETGKQFYKYTFRPGTGSMTSTLNADPAAGTNYVSTELLLQFNRMETTKRIEVSALAVGDLSVIVKDANGTYWYLGKDEPVTASAGTGQTGTARADGNYYQITLTDNAATWPLEVDGSIVEALLTTAE